MEIALLGGTGDIGEGLALRFGLDTDHELLIGSRKADRAEQAAQEYERRLQDRGQDPTISGVENSVGAADADVIILSIPHTTLRTRRTRSRESSQTT